MLAAAPLAASPDPLPTVKSAVASVIALVRSPEPTVRRSADRTMTAVERRAEIRRIAEQLFDFDEVGCRALWRHWAERTSDERAEFVRLFKALLARTYIGKIEMYSGETITFVGERIDGTAATVMSRVVNGKTRETTALDYRVMSEYSAGLCAPSREPTVRSADDRRRVTVSATASVVRWMD
jgi:ABC-type transporter MlaC component